MVTLILTSYQQSFSLPRDFILQILPESLFASALQEDVSSNEIVLDNPVITPNVMQILVDFSQGKEPKKHEPELVAADRYLNLPRFRVYAEPLYDRIKWNGQHVLTEAIDTDRVAVVEYLYRGGRHLSGHFLLRAVKSNSLQVAKWLLSLGRLNPSMNEDEPLRLAIEGGHLEMVRLLLKQSKVDPMRNDGKAIKLAAESKEIFFELIRDVRVDVTLSNQFAIRTAASLGYLDAVRFLLTNP